ncbi:MAG: DegT/DnrJ/EryC1/StrS family aminotransferase [Candidatus Omnitrophica bacterium]|nr:DegT/DnrJ/EryC1/StrS family aminotransferase [Candidatus Omnitrophota bacterium]
MEPWFSDEEKKALADYFDRGGWATEFEKTKELEKSIAEFTGSKHCVFTTSGTAALFLILKALGIGAGHEVIVPDFTMIGTANAVHWAGAEPVFVDIHPSNWCLDLDGVEKAITPKTKALILVSFNGRSPKMNRAKEIADRHKIFLIEDAAQSLGSRSKGQHLGTFGIAGMFSFSAPKVITTGQGGAIVTSSDELDQKIRQLKDFGRKQSGVDEHPVMGYNFKVTDIQSVIGIEQMKKLPWRLERKKEMYALYRKELEGVDEIEWVETNLEEASPWFIDVLVSEREELREFLKSEGVGTRPVYPPIHSQGAYGKKGSFPVTEKIAKHGLWLPSSSFLKDEDIIQICRKIKKFYLEV